MSNKWQRTFEVSVPVERVWRAFTEMESQRRATPENASRVDPNRDVTPRVLEVQPMKLLRWQTPAGTTPERTEFTVTFESTDGGSRFTVTRYGFGEGEDADVFSESNALGWQYGLMDLVFSLETGASVRRHFFGVNKSCTGVVWKEREWGLEVMSVLPGSFGAEVGLTRGDRVVRMAGASMYTRANIWTLLEQLAGGTTIDIEFVRNGEVRRASGRLSAYATAQHAANGE